MDIRLTHINLVFNFVDDNFDSNEIYNYLNGYITKIMISNSFEIPNDWVLLFQAGYSNARCPLVSKNKIGGYPSDKMKYITIVIPIPLKSEIGWGVDKDQHLYGKDHYDNLMKNFWELNINFRNYSNRTDYIIACMVAGIDKSFQEGFTVGGVKIKLKKK